jgi:hypothetical protein
MRSDDLTELAEKGFAQSIGFGSRPGFLIIDFINGFTDPISPMGSDASTAIAHTNRLILAARAKSVPIYFSAIRYDDPHCADAGIWLNKIKAISKLGPEKTQASRIRVFCEAGTIRSSLRSSQAASLVRTFTICFFKTGLIRLCLPAAPQADASARLLSTLASTDFAPLSRVKRWQSVRNRLIFDV